MDLLNKQKQFFLTLKNLLSDLEVTARDNREAEIVYSGALSAYKDGVDSYNALEAQKGQEAFALQLYDLAGRGLLPSDIYSHSWQMQRTAILEMLRPMAAQNREFAERFLMVIMAFDHPEPPKEQPSLIVPTLTAILGYAFGRSNKKVVA